LYVRSVFESIAYIAVVAGWSLREIGKIRLSEMTVWLKIFSEQEDRIADYLAVKIAQRVGELFRKK